MERTRNSKQISFSRKFNSNEHDDTAVEEFAHKNVHKTPTQQKSSLSQETDYSPVYVPQTQEAFDQLDVIWDWNSPQSKQRKLLPVQKRKDRCQSPKLMKRHASNSKIESYSKLKCELEALKNELESTGSVKHSNRALFYDDKIQDELQDLGKLFDDSFEEEMMLQSQNIERLLATQIENNICDTINVQNTIISNKSCESSKTELRKVKSENHIDASFRQLQRKSSSNSKIVSSKIPDLMKPNGAENQIVPQIKDVKEYSKENNHKNHVPINNFCNADEIEQKKLLAIAKLKSRKQATSTTFNRCEKSVITHQTYQAQHYKDETSPIKCSPEEIEQKRLQALAKLEAKKKQEKIERNRREALKRLEANKKKRATNLPQLYKK